MTSRCTGGEKSYWISAAGKYKTRALRMHGGSTIQLIPRNSFDGEKKVLATKQKRVCRIPGLLRKEEENMVIFSSRQKTPSYVSQHVPGEYYSAFPAMISCVVHLKQYLNILFKTFFLFCFFFTCYNYIINRQHFMILVQTVFK